ncbi:hypothetical protein BCR42DRAFT_116784 [Absidia repens]|uniref:Uncharacterized protein n=1 Tax=Absidia repens TaxID=90262 RepID=A0A1X2I5W1_9FUNG|nr:hypothetical protein BCR42DRAFT_116784 [Absidia repens]
MFHFIDKITKPFFINRNMLTSINAYINNKKVRVSKVSYNNNVRGNKAKKQKAYSNASKNIRIRIGILKK